MLKLATPFRSSHSAESRNKLSPPIRDRREHVEPLLLVEDKPELRAMLRKALERAGYAVDEAADGSAAVSKIRSRRYLLVLSDLKLPVTPSDTLYEIADLSHTYPRGSSRIQTSRPHYSSHSHYRLRLHRRSRIGDERWGLRFHPETGRSRSS